MANDKKFYERYISTHTGKLYGEVSLSGIKSQFSIWRRYFGKFLPSDKSATILDLGCGNGGLVYWLHERGYGNAEGIDISAEQIKAAEQLGITKISQAEAGDFLRRHPQKYDLIFTRDLLEHFAQDEVEELSRDIWNSLRDGGVLVAQTVNAQNLLWGRLRYGDFTHKLAFTAQSAEQLLKVCGFSSVEVLPQRPVIHGFVSLIRSFLWHIIEIGLRGYLAVETGSPRGIFTQNIIIGARKNARI